ncbi:MAG: hypothetical protein Q9218_007394, partial [Villophora microphyllina]
MTTPGGDWYFIRDPSQPLDDEEGANDSNDPVDAETQEEGDEDTVSDATSSDSWHPDIFDERREARAIGNYPIRRFRTHPSDAHMNPLLFAMARAAAQMRDLQSMSLTISMGSEAAGFEIFFHAANDVSKLDEGPGDADVARLY